MTKKSSKKRRPRAWNLVTFEEIEAWRSQRGIPKKRMAELLGVTNSTYHNWARGIAVATPNTQERIRGVLAGDKETTEPEGKAEVIRATGQIVSSYLRSQEQGLSVDGLTSIVREVRRALEE